MTSQVLPFLRGHLRSWRPTPAQQESAQDLLCNPTSCRSMASAIIKWARALPASEVLPRDNPTLLSNLLMPLLPWGLCQPWANDIPVSLLLDTWACVPQNTASAQSNTMNMAWATEIVRDAVVQPSANEERARTLAMLWFQRNLPTHGIWRWDMVQPEQLDDVYDAWVNMRLIAYDDNLRDLSQPTKTLVQSWFQTLKSTFKELSVEACSNVLIAVLASGLADKHKVLACKLAPPQSWLSPDVHAALRPLLPPADRACFQELPWEKQLPYSKMSSQDVAAINQQVAHLYCPALVVAFTVMLTPNDWSDRQLVQHAANMEKPRQAPPDMLGVNDLLL